MRIKLCTIAMLVVLLPTVAAAQSKCDRACLEGYVDRYLDAMKEHKVDPGLFAKNVIFTENGVRLPFGNEGLWYSMAGRGTYKFYVPDIETQQVAFIGTLKEGGSRGGNPTTIAFALRLKIVNKLITEVEQLAIRPEQSLFGGGGRGTGAGAGAGAGAAAGAGAGGFGNTGDSVEKMGAPNERFMQAIPEAERASREELIKTANHYFTGLQRWDGKAVYPFTDDCVRFENGMMASADVKKQFTDGSLRNMGVSRIRDRRFVAVDRERGIVFAFGFFDHVSINWTWQLAELFRIEKGKISRIEAVFHRCPYGTNSGWSTYEQGISEEYRSIK
ncbi:MAG: hypothetical protein H6Q04_1417 [Acidobacteria bacterium]|nr:hypothetical protein [Acidobacteriota bacterium]